MPSFVLLNQNTTVQKKNKHNSKFYGKHNGSKHRSQRFALKKTERYIMQNQSHVETWQLPSLIG